MPDYTLLTPEGYATIKQEETQTDFPIGTIIEADSENAKQIREIADVKLEKQIRSFIEANSKPNKPGLLVEDEAMKKFERRLEEGAAFVARKLFELTPASIRFNDDCDGISAGLLVKNSIEAFVREKNIPYPKNFLRNRQCNSAVYESGEASYDIEEMNAYTYGKRPLLFLLDFGANDESVQALEKARENFDVITIDHHVYSQKAASLATVFLNPLEFGGISSHTTGLVAYEFAQRLSKGERLYALLSMESDKSIYWDKTERKEALVLDYLAGENLSLAKYEKAIEKETQFHWLEASNKIKAAFEKALKKTKETAIAGEDGNAILFTVEMTGVVRKNSFPPKGKVLNKIQDHFEQANQMVAGVSFDANTMQFRVSKALHAKGFKATKIIGEVKQEFPQISGGGHEQAAAMRFDESIARAILEKTIALCEKEIAEKIGPRPV